MRAAVLFLLAGCGGSLGGGDDGDGTSDGGGNGSGDPGVERFIGRIAMTSTVQFGGGGYCTYSVTLKDVVVDVALHPSDGLATMVLADTRVEAIVGTCPYEPAPDNRQFFEVPAPQPAVAPDTYMPMLRGVASNSPITDVTSTVMREKDTRLNATVKWHRTDQPAPLDWTVETSVPILLDRVTCVMGGTYCLGGTQGAEYGCTDGVHLVKLKQCAAGCGATTLPPAMHVDEHCK